MRRLIKRLERVDARGLVRDLAERGAVPWRSTRGRVSGTWHDQLGQTLAERARTAESSIAHATGVYFPNRAHSARIAIKRLRYTAEIADATAFAQVHDALSELK